MWDGGEDARSLDNGKVLAKPSIHSSLPTILYFDSTAYSYIWFSYHVLYYSVCPVLS